MTYDSIIDLMKESAGEKLEPIRLNKFVARDTAVVAERMNGGKLTFAHITVMLNAGAIIFVGPNTQWKFGVYKNGDGFYYNDISNGRCKNRKPAFIKTEQELKELLIQDGFYIDKEPEQKPVRIEVSSVESIKKFDEMIRIPVEDIRKSDKCTDQHRPVILMRGEDGEMIPCDTSSNPGETVISFRPGHEVSMIIGVDLNHDNK